VDQEKAEHEDLNVAEFFPGVILSRRAAVSFPNSILTSWREMEFREEQGTRPNRVWARGKDILLDNLSSVPEFR
jgi:hypothetical protein